MNSPLAPYLFTLYLSVSVCWFLAFYAWRRRKITAAASFAAVMFSAGFWALFYGLELLTPTLSGKLFWFNVKQLGASALGPALLITALHFTNQHVRYPRLLYAVLLLEPIGSQLVFWTNSLHGLGGIPSLNTDVLPFPVLVFEYGLWFWLSIFVGYLLFIVSIFIFATQIPGANLIYRKQLILILLGMLMPWLAGSIALMGVGNLQLFDITTFLFPVSGLFIGLGFFRYQMLRLMPVAYSAVFSSIRDGIIIVDDDFRIVELNPAALRLLGHKERALLGQLISDVFPIWDQAILNEVPLGGNQTLEFYYEQGGQYRYLEVHGAAIVSNVHVATGHVLILYDVTERKLAEKARQHSEYRYRTIFETDSAATVILEEDMTISLANDGFVALSGYARDEVEGKKRWTEFVHPDDLPQMESYHRARRQQNGGNAPNQYEFRFLDGNGRIKDVFVSVALVPGSTTSIASLLDITARKLAERLLRQRATDLEVAVRSEQERSAIILQSVKDAIAVSDLSIKTTYVNEAFSTLTGYSFEESLGQPAQFILNGRMPQQTWRSLQQAITNQTVWEGELEFRRKNGTVYDAAVLIAPMRDGNDQLIGYVSSHRDITEAKRQEESRRRFVTHISHELRTPVTNIKLYADLLHRYFDTNRKEQYFTILHEQIERLETIIKNTLEIVALEEGKKELHREPIHWEMLIENLHIRLQAQVAEKNITLQFASQSAQLPITMGDPQRIFQALYELIYNAITYTPSGGNVLIKGETVVDQALLWLTISVCDDGPGIPTNEQNHIFDRFYRGEQADTGHIPGTGLGLSMAMLIAEAHNGRLTVKSDLGQGSTFTLWLPLH